MKKFTLGRFAPGALMLAIMAVTAPSVIAFAQRIFPGEMWRQAALISVTELAFIAWHITAHGHARGQRQHSVAEIMTLVSGVGVVAMAGVELALEFQSARLLNGTAAEFGTIGLGVLVALIAANLAATSYYQLSSPDRLERQAHEQAEALIRERTLEAINKEALQIASGVADEQARAFSEATRRDWSQRADETRDSVMARTPAGYRVAKPATMKLAAEPPAEAEVAEPKPKPQAEATPPKSNGRATSK